MPTGPTAFDDDSCLAAWDALKTAPPPVGYDPAIIPGWTAPDAPAFGVLADVATGVPRLLAGVPAEIREVPSLEPEVALELPEASYLIWAGTVAGPQPLSPQIRVDVRRQEGEREILVTLPVPRRCTGGG